MAANMIDPIATTVAGELPLTAAKMILAKIAAMGSPPGRCPTTDLANSMIRWALEPLERRLPARINIGIAISE
jgi:hypothetical protein